MNNLKLLFIIKIFNERLKQMKNLNVLNQTQKQEELKEINELKFKYAYIEGCPITSK